MVLCDNCLFSQADLGDGFVDCVKKGKTQQCTVFCENYIFKKVLTLTSNDYVKKWDNDVD